jgi:hypothetical protein
MPLRVFSLGLAGVPGAGVAETRSLELEFEACPELDDERELAHQPMPKPMPTTTTIATIIEKTLPNLDIFLPVQYFADYTRTKQSLYPGNLTPRIKGSCENFPLINLFES